MWVDFVLPTILGVIFVFIIFLIFLHYISQAGFEDKDAKIKKIVQHLGKKLTYQALKKRCPECTNTDYYRALQLI